MGAGVRNPTQTCFHRKGMHCIAGPRERPGCVRERWTLGPAAHLGSASSSGGSSSQWVISTGVQTVGSSSHPQAPCERLSCSTQVRLQLRCRPGGQSPATAPPPPRGEWSSLEGGAAPGRGRQWTDRIIHAVHPLLPSGPLTVVT